MKPLNRFRQRLTRADTRVNRLFAEILSANLLMEGEPRYATVIFETPDAPVSVPGGGEIQDHAPAFSAMTEEITGLKKNHSVLINGKMYHVTHIGSDEAGRTRVTLAYGMAGDLQPVINDWS